MGIVGVIPAAGYATRLQPLGGSKELLSVGGRPVMDYLVDRMLRGGADELRVVTRPDKEDVIAHAAELGAIVVLAHPATTSESFVAGMDGLAPRDIVLIGWPDTLWEPEDGYVSLVEAVEDGRREVALGLFQTPDLERSDVIGFDVHGRVTGIHVKPVDPPSSWIWGCAAARNESSPAWSARSGRARSSTLLCRKGLELHAVRLSSVWLDIGTKDALKRARSDPPILGGS